MNPTKIEWCDYTWNSLVGCTENCSYCYAKKQSQRFGHICQSCRTFGPHIHRERLDQPLKRKTPARIFTVSMGDMFDPGMQNDWIEEVMDIVFDSECHELGHTFMVLTKRPDRMKRFVNEYMPWKNRRCSWPSLWLGVSVENQVAANVRIPLLLETTAATRFVSFEPLLDAVTLRDEWFKRLDWVIIGGQTRPQITPPREHVEAIVSQAQDHKIPVFLKNNLLGAAEGRKLQEFPTRKTWEEVRYQ